MGYKETNPNGRTLDGGVRIPLITKLVVGVENEVVPVQAFTDETLESMGRAITRNMIRLAREAREAQKEGKDV